MLMFSWFRSKDNDDVRYATLRKRVTELELRCDDIESFYDNMRNMARKIQKRPEIKVEDDNPKDLKDSVLVAE